MTIYDIAKIAGVSKSTVSRVINNEESVNEQTRKRVLEVIKKNNYVPNKSARLLNSTSKKTLLVIMTRLDSNAEYQSVRGIIAASKEEYELVIYESRFDIDRTEKIVCENNYVDAVIIFAIGRQNYEFTDNLTIPVVFIGQKIYNKNSVYFQNKEAIELALNTASKHKKLNNIIYIGVDQSDPTTGQIRQAACESYCMDNNIKLKTIQSDYDSRSSFEQIKKVKFDDIDMIVCATDRIALGVYKELVSRNKTNIILSGIGNEESFNFIIDNFITVELNHLQAGYDTFEIIKNNEHKSIKQDIKVINRLNR